MLQCPHCQTVHVVNTLFCGECGAYLVNDDSHDTDPVGAKVSTRIGRTLDDLQAANKNGAISSLMKIRLSIEQESEIEVPLRKAVHLGRMDPTTNVFPEVDLTEYGGLEKGVSRRHARLIEHNGQVVVEDLGSINGTFINDEKLAPYLSQTIQDGDRLRLGHLIIEIGIPHG